MSAEPDTSLTDRLVDAYVAWREESARVWAAYEWWSAATPQDRSFAFCAYRATLEREDHASRVYANLIARLAATQRTPGGAVDTVFGAIGIACDRRQRSTQVVGSAE